MRRQIDFDTYFFLQKHGFQFLLLERWKVPREIENNTYAKIWSLLVYKLKREIISEKKKREREREKEKKCNRAVEVQ